MQDMLTTQEVKDYLDIDFNDEITDRKINRFINVADSYLKGTIGDNYPKDDERAKQLALFIIEDLYDRNSYNIKENITLEKLKNNFILQLQCESRYKDE